MTQRDDSNKVSTNFDHSRKIYSYINISTLATRHVVSREKNSFFFFPFSSICITSDILLSIITKKFQLGSVSNLVSSFCVFTLSAGIVVSTSKFVLSITTEVLHDLWETSMASLNLPGIISASYVSINLINYKLFKIRATIQSVSVMSPPSC